MSTGVFALALWLALGLERGLDPVLRLGSATPSFALPLLVFIGLYAPPRQATAAALGAGLVLDLLETVLSPGGHRAAIPGPNALGLALAIQLVLGARGLLFLNSPVTLVVVTPLAGSVWQIATASVMAVRELYDPIGFRAGPTLGSGLLSVAYSAGPALVLWFPLRWSLRLWRFDSPHVARWAGRHS